MNISTCNRRNPTFQLLTQGPKHHTQQLGLMTQRGHSTVQSGHFDPITLLGT